MRFLPICFVALSALLAACAPAPMAKRAANLPSALPVTLPPMKTFQARTTAPTDKSNIALAQDFLALAFQLESGRELPIFTRFEGPITLRVTGTPTASLNRDLSRLLGRLRNEAGIPVMQVPASAEAAITIEAIPQGQLQRLVPQAACFVAPRVSSWAEYKRLRRSALLDWTTLETRTKLAIFLPADVSPQEVRDCLHEELAQALGPLNDLYRLTDSVFNDDNFHTVLTGFDMLMLRAYYAPELRSGMTREAVAARLPAILARENPRGINAGTGPTASTPRAWTDAIEGALGPRSSSSARLASAKRAVEIARAQGWNDNRTAFSLFVLGRLSMGTNADQALTAFLQSDQIYRARRDTSLHSAHVAMQLAAYSLSAGQAGAALTIVNENLPSVAASENAALLATLLMVKAEALELLGRASEARAVRLDSLGWARYGFGSDRDVRTRLNEIAALSPAGRNG
ncbi:MAG: hypothetical protein ACJA2X_001046 [Halocynthiibacter sp.]|jgi:hypothetical protein